MINTFENFQKMYQEKLMTADEAVKSIKSGDTIAYGEFVTVPYALDAALARRVNELYDIDIDASTLRMGPRPTRSTRIMSTSASTTAP